MNLLNIVGWFQSLPFASSSAFVYSFQLLKPTPNEVNVTPRIFSNKCRYFRPLCRGLCDAPPKKNMGHWKGKCIFQISIFGFHVSCSRCNMLNVSPQQYPALALVGPAHLRCQAVCVRLQQGWGPRGSGIWHVFLGYGLLWMSLEWRDFKTDMIALKKNPC